MSNLLRFELTLAIAASVLVVWIVVTPNCVFGCGMFGSPEPTVGEWAALGLLAVGWAWIARLLYGARRQK